MNRDSLGGRTAALVLPLLLLTAACGGGDDTEPASGADTASESPSETPSESPSEEAAAAPLGGDGYTVQAPEGWEDATARFAEINDKVDFAMVDTESPDPAFSDNLNILRNAEFPEISLKKADKQFVQELGEVANDITVEDHVAIGGVESVHFTAVTTSGETSAFTEQYGSFVNDAWYVITFSYSLDTPEADRDESTATILDSWEWDA